MTEQAELTRPQSAKTIQTVNPATGKPGRSYSETSLDDALAAGGAAHQAFLRWKRVSFADRGAPSTRPPRDPSRARRANSRD